MSFLSRWKPASQFLRVMSLNSLSVAVKLVCGFITSKIIAVYIGPQGVGMVGNLRSLMSFLQTFSSLGFYHGVVKYTAQFKSDIKEFSNVFSTAFYSSMIVTTITSIVLYSFASFWSTYLFSTNTYAFAIKILSLSLFFLIINYFLLAILNGLEKYKKYVYTNVLINSIGLLITLFLIFNFKLKGLFLAIVAIPVISLLITFFFIRKEKYFFQNLKFKNIKLKYIKALAQYSLMSIVSTLLISLALISIRNYITKLDGLENMGYWEAMNRISRYYLSFTSSFFALYLYPKLSKATDNNSFKNEVFKLYKTIIPMIIIGLFVVYILRIFLIKLLLAETFLPMETLFVWQLPGDFFRIISGVLGYQLIARKLTKSYLLTEIFSVSILYFSSIALVKIYGFNGASMAYCICYFIYFITLLIYFRKDLFYKIINKL